MVYFSKTFFFKILLIPAHTRSRNSSSLLYNINPEVGMCSDLVEYYSTSVHLRLTW